MQTRDEDSKTKIKMKQRIPLWEWEEIHQDMLLVSLCFFFHLRFVASPPCCALPSTLSCQIQISCHKRNMVAWYYWYLLIRFTIISQCTRNEAWSFTHGHQGIRGLRLAVSFSGWYRRVGRRLGRRSDFRPQRLRSAGPRVFYQAFQTSAEGFLVFLRLPKKNQIS